MYPAHFFGLFPPFPREEKVFVAMSFAEQFQPRWEQVIAPAITDLGLEPFRVDASKISESILTDILKGISNSCFIFADVSVQLNGFRNPNVMYEVGMAHAVRQPEEVVLFRSDNKPLLFDLANIRVNPYDPDGNPEAAREKVRDALSEARREVDTAKSLTVQRAVERLDQSGFLVLSDAVVQGAVRHPELGTVGHLLGNMGRVQAILHLLELGLLTAIYSKVSSEVLEKLEREGKDPFDYLVYTATPLGKAVMEEIARRFGGERK